MRLEKIYVLYQTGEGVLSTPELFPAAIEGGILTFSVQSSHLGNETFRGKISPSRIQGEFRDAHGEIIGEKLNIPRQSRVENPVCK